MDILESLGIVGPVQIRIGAAWSGLEAILELSWSDFGSPLGLRSVAPLAGGTPRKLQKRNLARQLAGILTCSNVPRALGGGLGCSSSSCSNSFLAAQYRRLGCEIEVKRGPPSGKSVSVRVVRAGEAKLREFLDR